MRIIVKAKPRSRENRVQKIDDSNFVVFIKEDPKLGRANQAIIELLAKYFHTSPLLVEIRSGRNSRTKVVQIHE